MVGKQYLRIISTLTNLSLIIIVCGLAIYWVFPSYGENTVKAGVVILTASPLIGVLTLFTYYLKSSVKTALIAGVVALIMLMNMLNLFLGFSL